MTDSGDYAARAAAIRETSKWIAAVFAAAGAVLFSGLSFTNVEKAASTQDWELPVVLAAVPVLAAIWAIWAAVTVILQAAPPTHELLPSLGAAGGEVAPERSQVERLLPATVAVYGGLDGFEAHLTLVRDEVDNAKKALAIDNVLDRRAAVSAKLQQLAELQDGVRDIVLCAAYLRVQARYIIARRIFVGAALVAVVASAGSGVAAASAERAKSVEPATTKVAQFLLPQRVQVYLSDGGRRRHASLPCGSEGRRVVAIGGDYRRPVLVFSPGAGCAKPVTWEPGANDALLVPDLDAR